MRVEWCDSEIIDACVIRDDDPPLPPLPCENEDDHDAERGNEDVEIDEGCASMRSTGTGEATHGTFKARFDGKRVFL